MIGKLSRNGTPLVDQVELTILEDARCRDGQPGWRGEAWIPLDRSVFPGERLHLELANGQREDIHVDRVTVDSAGERMLIRFTPAD